MKLHAVSRQKKYITKHTHRHRRACYRFFALSVWSNYIHSHNGIDWSNSRCASTHLSSLYLTDIAFDKIYVNIIELNGFESRGRQLFFLLIFHYLSLFFISLSLDFYFECTKIENQLKPMEMWNLVVSLFLIDL